MTCYYEIFGQHGKKEKEKKEGKKQQTLHDVAKMNEIRGTEYAGSQEKIPVTLSRLDMIAFQSFILWAFIGFVKNTNNHKLYQEVKKQDLIQYGKNNI